MANKAKHAFGSSERVLESIANGVINSYDILFLDGDTDNPKIGWIDKDGNPVILKDEKADLTEIEAELATKATTEDVAALETELATKANVKDVDAKIAAAMGEHLTKKYEIADVPVGTVIDYRDSEIRVMAPVDAEWVKQSVGEGGDANSYYMTFKTYCPEGAVGYIEHLGNQVDSEILTDLRTDEYGRKYQPTWLALAKYDEATGAWTYYGEKSTVNHYIGWDYKIQWFNADNVMIGSDCVRINLSNENCHATIEPYYVSEVKNEVEAMVETKIAEVGSMYEIVEF